MIWDRFGGFSGRTPQINTRHSMKIKTGAICCTLREPRPSEQSQTPGHHFFKALALQPQPHDSTTAVLPKRSMISHQEPPCVLLSSPWIHGAARTRNKTLLPWKTVGWQWWVQPQRGRATSEQGCRRGKEMAITPGRSLGKRRKDVSNRKQTYLTFQSLIRLAGRSV